MNWLQWFIEYNPILHFFFVGSEIEAKQKTELASRNVQMDLRSSHNVIKQVGNIQWKRYTMYWLCNNETMGIRDKIDLSW